MRLRRAFREVSDRPTEQVGVGACLLILLVFSTRVTVPLRECLLWPIRSAACAAAMPAGLPDVGHPITPEEPDALYQLRDRAIDTAALWTRACQAFGRPEYRGAIETHIYETRRASAGVILVPNPNPDER